MADIEGAIQSRALLFMQAWMNRDAGTIRNLAHRDCTLMIGTTPPQLLDRPSLLAAMDRGLDCTGFRLGEAVVNRHGKSVWWSAGAELQLKLGRIDWSGPFIITDLWRKTVFGGWKLAERSLAPTANDDDNQMSAHIRQLQLWR